VGIGRWQPGRVFPEKRHFFAVLRKRNLLSLADSEQDLARCPIPDPDEIEFIGFHAWNPQWIDPFGKINNDQSAGVFHQWNAP
jgi:hypothetical protein